MARLVENSYGKGRVRLTKVVRNGAAHELYEFDVNISLGGAFEVVYTKGDNAPCIPTDTMKNTVYALGKKHAFTSPEEYGLLLTQHFVEKFSHVAWAQADIEQALWGRIDVAGKPHEHAFVKQAGKRTCRVRLDREKPPQVSGGVRGLEVLKTTKSGFVGFLRDEYTTLKETTDRIFATSVDAVWDLGRAAGDFNAVFETAKRTILEVFATHESLGVQQTIFAMGEEMLHRAPAIEQVSFKMPNQHRILVNLEPFKMTNNNEIFVATDEPHGLIRGTIAR